MDKPISFYFLARLLAMMVAERQLRQSLREQSLPTKNGTLRFVQMPTTVSF